jgi:hypothetical protein
VLSRRNRASAAVALGLSLAAVPEVEAGRLWVNGVQFELRSMVLAGDPASLARKLDGRWGARQGGTSEPSSREILGRQRGPFHETLTLLPGPRHGTSRLLVAVQDLRVPPVGIPPAPVPLPAGARLVNVVQFGPSATSAAVFTIDVPGTPVGSLRRFWRAAAALGWQASATTPPSKAPGGAVWARRGNRELTMVAVPAGKHVRLVLLLAGDRPGDGFDAGPGDGPGEGAGVGR